MKKYIKSLLSFSLITAILLSSVCIVSAEGLKASYKKWNFLEDAYNSTQGYPTNNTYNGVWSTWVYSGEQVSAMKPVSTLSGITPAMWSANGESTGAPIIQVRPTGSTPATRFTPSETNGGTLLRWTSNINGTVKVTVQVQKENSGGDGTTVVLNKGTSELETLNVAADDTALKEISKVTKINEGDTFEVALLANSTSTNDVSAMNMIIEEVDALSFDKVPTFSYTYNSQSVDYIQANGTVRATFGVKNSSDEPVSAVGLLAVYTDDDRFTGVGIDKQTVPANGSVTLNLNVADYTPVNYSGGFKLKLFVLDSLNTMVPLYKGFSYPSTEKRVWDFEADNVAMGYPSTVPFGDTYGAGKVWSYGMGDNYSSTRTYDFKAMLYDATTNTWYNGEEPIMDGVSFNFPYIKVDKTTGESELQTRVRDSSQNNWRLHPIVRFISPIDGEVEIDITLTKKLTGGDGLWLMMGTNGSYTQENSSLIAFGANAGTGTYNTTLTVTKGDCVDFILHGSTTSNAFDASRLQLTITEK